MGRKDKDRDSSDSSSDDSDDSRSSDSHSRNHTKKKKSDKISSSKHHSRKSRKSYKHRDDKKKKRRRSSSSSQSSKSRSRSRSKSASKSRHRIKNKSRTRSKSNDHKKKPISQAPEKKPAAMTEEEIQRDKERKRQIRLAKLRASKYEQEDDTPTRESPVIAPSMPEQVESINEEPLEKIALLDKLEMDSDEDIRPNEKPALLTTKFAPTAMPIEDDEVDPLDAYMNEINQVAKQQVIESLNQDLETNGINLGEPRVDHNKMITFEEIERLYQQQPEETQEVSVKANQPVKTFKEDELYQKPNGINGGYHEEEDMEDEDEFHKAFMDAMKKKEAAKQEAVQKDVRDEKSKKNVPNKHDKGEILDDDIEGYMDFREDNDPEQDFLTRQKKQAERKELKNIDQSEIEYLPFRKNFYIEAREITNMSSEEVELYRKELGEIQVRGRDCPKPIRNWYQCGLNDAILHLLVEKRKYASPFPIQCQSIPAIMSGRDVIGVAETGSGKTLAYVLPMLRHIKDQRPLAEGDGPVGLIMAPTRELAWQIYTECKSFTKAVGMNVACVYGGAGVQGQIADLKRGAEIVVCTPGRMIDVLSTSGGKITNLRRVTFVVLDEADRMLDFGFEPQINRIMSNTRPDRQTAMFSATFPRNVEQLAKKVLTKPVEIIVGTRGKISSNVEQIIEVILEEDKFLRLLKILGDWSDRGSILIFVNRQSDADNLFKELLKFAYFPLVLHGGQDADDRENTISDFKKGVRTLMIATSVCARGLDIKSLVLVVNYQCPQHKEDYIHRIGRTGRAGNKGTAITFIQPEEDQYAFDLITALKMSNIEPPQDLVTLADDFKKKVERGEAKFYNNKNLAGTGFRFDKSEKDKVKAVKHAIKQQFNFDLNISDGEISDEEIVTTKEDKNSKDNQIDDNHIRKMLKDPNTRAAVTRAAEKAAKDAILAGSDPDSVLQAAHNAIRSILSQYRGTGAENVAKLVSEIEEREDESNERVSADLEINDYPQAARNKVTQRDFLASMHDLTNCNVSVRGVFTEPGKKVAPGHKKLRLHIVGESKYEVETAYREIKRIIEEKAAELANTVGGHTGKFTL